MPLKTPLGIWTKESHQHFNSFLSDNEVHAFLWRNNKWDKFRRSRFNRRRTVYRLIEQDCELSAIVHPTTVSNVTATMLQASGSARCDFTDKDDDGDTWPTFFRTLPQHIRQHFSFCSLPNSLLETVQLIRTNSLIAVVDGSFNPETRLGTACWILTSTTREDEIKGSAQAPGDLEDMDAYRAETFGLYCTLLIIKHICDYFQIQEGGLTLACDCVSALNDSLVSEDGPKVTKKDYDLIKAIYYLRQDIPIAIRPRHVRGHQDRNGNQLDLWALLNCECDYGAKNHMEWISGPLKPDQCQLYGNQWQVLLKYRYIARGLREKVITHIHGNELKRHIARREKIPISSLDSVDWEAIHKASKKILISSMFGLPNMSAVSLAAEIK